MRLLDRRVALATAIVTTLLASLLGTGTVEATDRPACSPVRQLTTTTTSLGVLDPAASDDFAVVVFRSAEDLTGANGDLNREIFRLEVETGDLLQVTDTTGANAVGPPAVDGDGDTVVFTSDRDLVGDNADGNDELFLWAATGPTVTQLTETTTGTLGSDPSVSADGTRVAFSSDRNLGGGNADLTTEVFIRDTEGPGIQVTTSGAGFSTAPEISTDGSTVVFLSSSDLTGDNADGSVELYRWDGSATTQLTAGSTFDDSAVNPVIDTSGTTVAFTSLVDHLGTNPDGNEEVFRSTTATSGADLTQDSHSVGDDARQPSLAGNGDRVFYTAVNGPDDPNPSGTREVFVTTAAGGPAAVTRSRAAVASPIADDDGDELLFTTYADLLGANSDDSTELYLARCGATAPVFTDVATTNVFFGKIQWMAALEIASGFPDGGFHPQDGVKRQQMANFLYNLVGPTTFTPPTTPTFPDVPTSNVFYPAIEWMAAEGIASGFPDGTFAPQGTVNRQQMANFLRNLVGEPFHAPPSPTFADVPTTSVFYDAIEWMAANEVASGFPDGTYRPRDLVKRQQMANFLHNLTLCCSASLVGSGPS